MEGVGEGDVGGEFRKSNEGTSLSNKFCSSTELINLNMHNLSSNGNILKNTCSDRKPKICFLAFYIRDEQGGVHQGHPSWIHPCIF